MATSCCPATCIAAAGAATSWRVTTKLSVPPLHLGLLQHGGLVIRGEDRESQFCLVKISLLLKQEIFTVCTPKVVIFNSSSLRAFTKALDKGSHVKV